MFSLTAPLLGAREAWGSDLASGAGLGIYCNDRLGFKEQVQQSPWIFNRHKSNADTGKSDSEPHGDQATMFLWSGFFPSF